MPVIAIHGTEMVTGGCEVQSMDRRLGCSVISTKTFICPGTKWLFCVIVDHQY